ncbi:MAG: cytochrome c [Cohaesibacter sp.]|nr:cytochrome c [Cohaesibacter sp.]
MMIKRAFLTFVFLSSTTPALAHQGVKNPAVKARMDSMVAIKTAMKTLDDMAKGRVPFAKEAAQKASSAIKYQAALAPVSFR